MGFLRGRGAAPDHPGFVAGNWYPVQRSNVGSAASVADVMYCHPVYLPRRVTITALGVYVITGAALSNLKAAIYANDPATSRPGARLLTAGPIDTSASATFASASLAADVSLPAGLYWAATVGDGTPTVAAYNASTFTSSGFQIGNATGSLALHGTVGSTVNAGLLGTATYAAGPPASFGTATYPSAGTQPCPVVAIKAA